MEYCILCLYVYFEALTEKEPRDTLVKDEESLEFRPLFTVFSSWASRACFLCGGVLVTFLLLWYNTKIIIIINFQKEIFLSAYTSRRAKLIVAGKCGSKEKARRYEQEAQKSHTQPQTWSIETGLTIRIATHSPNLPTNLSSKTSPPRPPQTVTPAEDQLLKCLTLWGPPIIQTTKGR